MTCSVVAQLRAAATRGLSQRHTAQLLGINREKIRVLCQAIHPPVIWPNKNQSIGSKVSYEGRRGEVTEKMAIANLKLRKAYMIVEGHTISATTLEKTTVRAVTSNGFTFGELQGWLRRYGAPEEAIYHGAARLLQKWKKEGKLLYRNAAWHWQGIVQ